MTADRVDSNDFLDKLSAYQGPNAYVPVESPRVSLDDGLGRDPLTTTLVVRTH